MYKRSLRETKGYLPKVIQLPSGYAGTRIQIFSAIFIYRLIFQK